MMNNITKCLFFLLCVITCCACAGDDDQDPDRPVIGKEYINVPPNMQLLAEGQVADLRIEANCSWTIILSEDWLTVSPMSGNKSQNVTVSAGRNATGRSRTAVITIKGGSAPERSVMVTQNKVSEVEDTKKEPESEDNQPPG